MNLVQMKRALKQLEETTYGDPKLSTLAAVLQADLRAMIEAMPSPRIPDELDEAWNLDGLTYEEMVGLQKRTYERASTSTPTRPSLIYRIALIPRYLGKSRGHQKMDWHMNDPGNATRTSHRRKAAGIYIYEDRYGNYMTVDVDGKQVVSTHGTSQLFVPGPWVNTLEPYMKQAEQVKVEHEEQQRNIKQERKKKEMDGS